jgi:type I restriction enzyme S subunit
MGKWKTERVGKLGYTYSGLSGKTADDFGEGAPYIPYMNVFTNTIVDTEFLEYVKVGRRENQNEVKPGDALFTTSSETPHEVGMSSVITKDVSPLYLNSFCFGYRLYDKSAFDSTFFAYLLRSEKVRRQMFISAQGSTRHNLSKKNFNTTEVYYPEDVSEQSKIAEILSTVDEAIKKTSDLIVKYKNIKVGIMQDLLDNGIDKDGVIRSPQTHEYKDSSLGEIPVEWDVIQIGDMASKVGSGSTPRGGQSVYEREGIMFLRSQNITHYGLDLDDVAYINERTHRQMRRSWVEYGDVLLNITGASIGRCCLYPFEIPANVNQHVCIIRSSLGLNQARLLFRWLFSYGQRQIDILMAGGNREGLNFEQVKQIKMPLIRDEKEVQSILEVIDQADQKIETERDYLAKLQDMKLGLMQDLLTNTVSVEALL